jgi:hypothetical protein
MSKENDNTATKEENNTNGKKNLIETNQQERTDTTLTTKDEQQLPENNEESTGPTFMQKSRNVTGSVFSPIGSVISTLLPFKNIGETITLNPATWHLDIFKDNNKGPMHRGKAIATNTFTTILGIAAGVGTYFGIKEVSGTIAETLAKVFSNIFKDVLPAFSKEILETIINIATPLIAGFAVAHVADKGINKIARTYNEGKELIKETNNTTFQKKVEEEKQSTSADVNLF